jgi:putative hydrolase of the HAD superfamily
VVQVGTLLLDFGGPLLRTPFELLRATERRLGLSRLTFDWRGPFDPDGDPLWQRLQAGMISEPEYWAVRAAEFATVTGRSSVRAMMRELFCGPEDEVVRTRKPDPRAYRAALDMLGVTAPEAVFVDDQPVNVDGARAVGIPAVLFDVVRPAQSYAQALALLNAQT